MTPTTRPRDRRRRPRPWPYARLHPDGSLTICAYFVPLLPYRLRQAIPLGARRWDVEQRRWIIAAPYAAVGIRVFRGIFPDATLFTPAGRV